MATSKTTHKASARQRSGAGGKVKPRAAQSKRPKSAAASSAKSKSARNAASRPRAAAAKAARKPAGKAKSARAALKPAKAARTSSKRPLGRSAGAARSRTGKVGKSKMEKAKARSVKSSKPAAKVAKSAAKSAKSARSSRAVRPLKGTPAVKAGAAKARGGKVQPPLVAVARPSRDGGKFRLPHIDDRTLKKIVEKLEEMREESRNIVYQNVQTDLKPREEASDVGDDLDQASNERDREFNLIMHQRHLRRLQQVEEAFERIADGSYGLCEGTDEPINPKRLLIMPLARYSLEYQEQQEKMLGRVVESEGYLEGEDSFAAEE
jgi:RNA polymerase-binding transcription factor